MAETKRRPSPIGFGLERGSALERRAHDLVTEVVKELEEQLKTKPNKLSERARLSLSTARVKRRMAPDNARGERMTRLMIDRSFENIKLIRKRMANDQLEIDRLRRETRAMLTQILA